MFKRSGQPGARKRINLRKTLFILPNLVTLSSVFCGFDSIRLSAGAGSSATAEDDFHRAAILIAKDEHRVDAKSIMGVLLLCGTQGSTLTISASGEDAQEAVSALVALVSDRFGEAE